MVTDGTLFVNNPNLSCIGLNCEIANDLKMILSTIYVPRGVIRVIYYVKSANLWPHCQLSLTVTDGTKFVNILCIFLKTDFTITCVIIPKTNTWINDTYLYTSLCDDLEARNIFRSGTEGERSWSIVTKNQKFSDFWD